MKKIISVILTIAIALALMLTMISCEEPETAKPLEVAGGFVGNWVYLFVDPETKVEYFILDGGSNGGRAMIPRYNADGSLYTEDKP